MTVQLASSCCVSPGHSKSFIHFRNILSSYLHGRRYDKHLCLNVSKFIAFWNCRAIFIKQIKDCQGLLILVMAWVFPVVKSSPEADSLYFISNHSRLVLYNGESLQHFPLKMQHSVAKVSRYDFCWKDAAMFCHMTALRWPCVPTDTPALTAENTADFDEDFSHSRSLLPTWQCCVQNLNTVS